MWLSEQGRSLFPFRKLNPWNYPVKIHTYAEYEDDFREKMKAAGLPVEKE